jgi:hypothetical protein
LPLSTKLCSIAVNNSAARGLTAWYFFHELSRAMCSQAAYSSNVSSRTLAPALVNASLAACSASRWVASK